jgi:DNA-binding LacI/PurR family transcriptional regulator
LADGGASALPAEILKAGDENMVNRMIDVAERAGVSVATVSHFLNKTRYISPETQQRVLEVIQELNYHKNAHARRLAQSRSDLFGLIISEIANPFFPEIIKGFQSAAWEKGYEMLLCNTEYDPAHARAAVRKMIESDVRGVAIMTSALGREVAADLTSREVGLVYYNLGPIGKLVSNIRIDYSQGIAQAINYVIEQGHRQVAVIAGPRTNRTAVFLRDAIVEGLEQRGLHPSPVLESDYKVDGGVSAVSALLSQPSFPTAIFCGNDLTAMGAMSALEEVGIRVPEDVSVIGFDDIFFARLSRPPLTTIHIPRERLGRLAFESLEKMDRSKRHRGLEHIVETALVIRKSTAPRRKHELRLPTG